MNKEKIAMCGLELGNCSRQIAYNLYEHDKQITFDAIDKCIRVVENSSNLFISEASKDEMVWRLEQLKDQKMKIEEIKCSVCPYKQQWIPCSERLPEQPKANPKLEGRYVELYLVVENEGDYPFRAFWNGKAFTDGMFPLGVIAWMPLPEPYETNAEREEE